MQTITHWWGIEHVFSKKEKHMILDVLKIGSGAGTATQLAVLFVEGATNPVLFSIMAMITVEATTIHIMNHFGKGGFRVITTFFPPLVPPFHVILPE